MTILSFSGTDCSIFEVAGFIAYFIFGAATRIGFLFFEWTCSLITYFLG